MVDAAVNHPNNSVLQNVEAEQKLLGAILANNDIFDRVVSLLRVEHFSEPLHCLIYDFMSVNIAANKLISHTILNSLLENSDQLRVLGGTSYLEGLIDVAISPCAARGYAELIRDLAVRRELVRLGRELIAAAQDAEGSELANLAFRTQDELERFSKMRADDMGFVTFFRSAVEAVNSATSLHHGRARRRSLQTGLFDLDNQLGGLWPSDLIILAGRPSMGITALAAKIAFNISNAFREEPSPSDTDIMMRKGGVVGVFSHGIGSDQLASCVLSNVSKVPVERVWRGDLSGEQFDRFVKAAKLLENLPLYIDDCPSLHINEVRSRCRSLKRAHGLDLVIVDYWQMWHCASKAGGDTAEISRGLKLIAKELNVPVLALSAVSDAVENRKSKRPRLSDLREFGMIEQDADVVMFLYRDTYYHDQERPEGNDVKFTKWLRKSSLLRGKAEVIISKQRYGATGMVTLAFEGEFMHFSDHIDI